MAMELPVKERKYYENSDTRQNWVEILLGLAL